jgi:REP element-mobilizing transposase RayT
MDHPDFLARIVHGVQFISEDLFALFDPASEVDVTWHHLPHWQQDGKTYFITFRAADSLPASVVAEWYNARSAWLKSRKIDPANPQWRKSFACLPIAERRQFHAKFSEQFHRFLDDCHGKCVFRSPSLARIVADSLLHFDRQRYERGDFVVMPNHVHMLVQFTTVKMKVQCDSWKHFTAVRINRAIGESGSFWQTEAFDHLVRSPEQFSALRQYIADNPRKANLNAGEYLHYVRPNSPST